MKNYLRLVLRFVVAVVICAKCGWMIGDFITSKYVAGKATAAAEQGASLQRLVDTTQVLVQDPPRRTSRRPAWPTPGDINKRGNSLMLQSFEEVVAPSVKSTVRLSVRNRQIALGAIVAADGWIVTKASQLPGQLARKAGKTITCTLYDHTDYPAVVQDIDREADLALLHIAASGLTPVEWTASSPRRGNWLATTDVYSTPAAVGVTSSGLQAVQKSTAVLGVVLVDSPDGAIVEEVLPTSGAAEAGLQENDKIYSLNGATITSRDQFRSLVADSFGGEPLELGVTRGNRRLHVTARLMDLSDELLDETEMEVSGQVSHRSTGFKRVFLHDTVLRPNQCGGPIVDLDGKVAGINIARAGRVHSYAIPADVVQPLVQQLVAEARLVSRNPEPASTASEIR
ncbi:MAG: PDZ domain-containing protein [Aureliella sp.]